MATADRQQSKSNGFAVTALVVGIVAFLFGWTGLIGLILAVAALTFGFLGLYKKQNHGMAITGLILGGLAFLTALVFCVVWLVLIVSAPANKAGVSVESNNPPVPEQVQSGTVEQPPTPPVRQISGELATLGAGMFIVGVDIKPGLYDITGVVGESGNLISDDGLNEILGSQYGVSKVRSELKEGEELTISGLNSVTFTPVVADFVTEHMDMQLYSGEFIVGEDIGEGRYRVTPGAGNSGNFITSGGVNEILGSQYGVSEVTVTLRSGQEVLLSGLDTVTFTAI